LNNLNLLGAQIDPPDNPGTWIGKLWREKICTILTCLLKPRLIVPIDNGNGIPVPQDAIITMGRNGWTAMFPALAAAGAISGGGGGSNWLRVKDDQGASLLCHSWDGTTEGSAAIYVAKPQDLRNTIATENIRGTVFTYSYTLSAGANGMHFLTRTATGGSVNTTDYITKDYLTNDEIWAETCAAITLDGHACSLIDDNRAGRAFASV
jgi:hypothetical protein